MKHIRVFLSTLVCCALLYALSACTGSQSAEKDGRLQVVTTIFPQYDFVRQIAGDLVSVSMLLPPGSESHSFEPTPQDMIAIQNCDLFLLIGGASDAWAEKLLSSMDGAGPITLALIDCVEALDEEAAPGMQGVQENGTHNHLDEEYDEHIWTSPRNAMLMVQSICDQLCALDPDNAQAYEQNTADYLLQLSQLDQDFQNVVAQGSRDTIVMGDRFPFLYFVRAYGLNYYAAFPGCSAETEANAATIAFLIKEIKAQQIPVVFHEEMSNEKVADILCEATGAKKLLLHACHSITKDQLEGGATYLSLMEQNVRNLKEALS